MSSGVYVASPRWIFVGVAFCAVFAAVGFAHFIPSLGPRFWKSLPCEVHEFEIVDDVASDEPFSARVRFGFEWEGAPREGTKLGREGWRKASAPIALAVGFAEDKAARCYLPDGTPGGAVLLRPPPKWGSLAFIGFGLCVGWILFQAHRNRQSEEADMAAAVMPTLALVFGTPGIVLLLILSLPTWRDQSMVGELVEVPATVVWSTVRTTQVSGKHGSRTKRWADVCYEYQLDGKTWRNNGMSFNRFEEISRSETDTVLDEYPPGRAITCWVHPSRPGVAVLRKDMGWSILFTLFPLPFVGVGFLCALSAWRGRGGR